MRYVILISTTRKGKKMNTGIDTHEGNLVVDYVSPREEEIRIAKLVAEAIKRTNELLADKN